MLTAQLFTEAIVSRPLNLKVYLTNRIRLLDAIIPAVERACAVIKAEDKAGGEGDYVFGYAMKQAGAEDYSHPPSDYSIDLNRHYQLPEMRDSLAAIVQHGPNMFLKYAIGHYEYIKPVDESVKQTLHLAAHVDAGLAEYGFEPGSDDPEYISAKKMADAYTVIARALDRIEPMYANMRAVFADMTKQQNYTFDPDKYRPDHGEVELLYHASLHAADLVANGFSAEKPKDRRGLGNFGEQGEISFTHSLKIAHDIMRGLRDLWMIVHGEITYRTIVGWIKHEGLDLKQLSASFSTSKEPPDSLYNTIGLYRAFCWMTKLRTNPVFVSADELIPALRTLDFKDIGIVACEVRLDGTEEYKYGEKEFRVTADRVVGPVKRVV